MGTWIDTEISINFEALGSRSQSPVPARGEPFLPIGSKSSKLGDLEGKIKDYEKFYEGLGKNFTTYSDNIDRVMVKSEGLGVKDALWARPDIGGNLKFVELRLSILPYESGTFTFLGMPFMVTNDDTLMMVVNNNGYTIALADVGDFIKGILNKKGSVYGDHFSMKGLKFFVESLKMGNFEAMDFVDTSWPRRFFATTFNNMDQLYKSTTITMLQDSDVGQVHKKLEAETFSYEDFGIEVGNALSLLSDYYTAITSIFSSLDALVMAFKTIATEDIDIPNLLSPSMSVISGICKGYTEANDLEEHSALVASCKEFVEKIADPHNNTLSDDNKQYIMASMISIDSYPALSKGFFDQTSEVYTAASALNLLKYTDPDLLLLGEEDPETLVEDIVSLMDKNYLDSLNSNTTSGAFSIMAKVLTGEKIITGSDDNTEMVGNIVHGDFKDQKFVIPDHIKASFSIPKSGLLYKKIGDLLVSVFSEVKQVV